MAQGRRTSIKIVLTDEEKRELESWQRSTTMPVGLVKRGQIILMLAAGNSVQETARTVKINDKRVYKWAYRFLENKLDGLADKHRTGRKPTFSPSTRRTCCQTGM